MMKNQYLSGEIVCHFRGPSLINSAITNEWMQRSAWISSAFSLLLSIHLGQYLPSWIPYQVQSSTWLVPHWFVSTTTPPPLWAVKWNYQFTNTLFTNVVTTNRIAVFYNSNCNWNSLLILGGGLKLRCLLWYCELWGEYMGGDHFT